MFRSISLKNILFKIPSLHNCHSCVKVESKALEKDKRESMFSAMLMQAERNCCVVEVMTVVMMHVSPQVVTSSSHDTTQLPHLMHSREVTESSQAAICWMEELRS